MNTRGGFSKIKIMKHFVHCHSLYNCEINGKGKLTSFERGYFLGRPLFLFKGRKVLVIKCAFGLLPTNSSIGFLSSENVCTLASLIDCDDSSEEQCSSGSTDAIDPTTQSGHARLSSDGLFHTTCM